MVSLCLHSEKIELRDIFPVVHSEKIDLHDIFPVQCYFDILLQHILHTICLKLFGK